MINKINTISFKELEEIYDAIVNAQIALTKILNKPLRIGDYVFFNYPNEGILKSIITAAEEDCYAGHAVDMKNHSHAAFANYPRHMLIPYRVIRKKK